MTGIRLRDIAASLDITERSAFGIITDLVEAGYVVEEKNGYHIQAHLPLPEPDGRERAVGEILAPGGRQDRRTAAPHPATTWEIPPNENSASRPSENAQGGKLGRYFSSKYAGNTWPESRVTKSV